MSFDDYPCPCCGYLVFKERPGSFKTCPICFWKDDLVQLAFPLKTDGANTLKLSAAQGNFQRIGASEEQFAARVRAPKEQRAEGWRPFDASKDQHLWWGSSNDREYWQRAGDPDRLYWWRPDFWLLQESQGWRFFQAIPQGRSCQIGGISVWDRKWSQTPGEMVIVKDPRQQRTFRFPVYQVSVGARRVVFAAGEFSSGMWGFYVASNS